MLGGYQALKIAAAVWRLHRGNTAWNGEPMPPPRLARSLLAPLTVMRGQARSSTARLGKDLWMPARFHCIFKECPVGDPCRTRSLIHSLAPIPVSARFCKAGELKGYDRRGVLGGDCSPVLYVKWR